MLTKLLKYDLKWIYKLVSIFYILAFIFSVIGRALGTIENSLIFDVTSKIAFGCAISMIVSSLINTLMRLWVRFVRNMYKDESYLTHTLPVKKSTIYASKVLSGLICIVTATIVAIGCLFICYYSETNIEALKGLLKLAATTYNTTVVKLLISVILIVLLELIFILITGYVGIICGHRSNKSKMAKTIIIGFLIYMICQVISLGAIAIYGLFDQDIMNLINTTEIINIDAIKTVIYIASVMYIIYIVILYFIGQKLLNKGVNIE